MAKQKAAPRLTRKHLARAQRDRLASRILIVGVGLVLAAVVLVVGYGIVEQEILLPRRPAVTVNGDEISRDELGARTALAQADLAPGEAERRGIIVTEAEIQLAIEEGLGFYADGTPTPGPTGTPDATLAAQATATSTAAATGTPAAPPTRGGPPR